MTASASISGGSQGLGRTSYQPVITIFSVALLTPLAVNWCTLGIVVTIRAS
ncbi:MAG: hypothetical protein RIC04_14080 [Parvibaculum sp.]|uniref:hypothetical protein n=1 Tax=Parvibaculum sp. TaxID=2024848 RepID=UPI0032EFCE24